MHDAPYPVRRDFLNQVAERAWITRRIFDSFLTYQDVLDGKLQAIKAPVLVIWGKEEKLIPMSVGEEMKQQIPNASLLVCNDSGHLAIYECWNQLKPERGRLSCHRRNRPLLMCAKSRREMRHLLPAQL